MKDILNRLIAGESLTEAEAEQLMGRMMDEEFTPIQLAGLLVALRTKGESTSEVVGFARAMRARARQLCIDTPLADTCGTGGDARGTFNISTAAALIVAACGQPVAKHGNRAASGRCGSADVLEALGVEITLPPEGVERCIQESGIGFLFAPAFHPATRFAAVPRRELGVRTIFNILGPLSNPARPRYQLVGVSSPDLLDLMAEALLALGDEAALVVHSQDGTDEITVSGRTMVREVRNGEVRSYLIDPSDFGVPPGTAEGIRGGDASENAAILMGVLEGRPGASRDAAVINAAGALFATGRAPSLSAGARQAEHAVDSGAAGTTLDRLRTVSQAARQHAAQTA